MSPLYRLYRYEHGDGTAKEWAYADLGNGTAQIRWGPAGRLRQTQSKPLPIALERAREKRLKGYVAIGRADIDATGAVALLSRDGPDQRVTPAGSATPTPAPKPARDIAALLGADDDGFYF
ncbi:hypothetical protein [Thiocapsa roseopersicina]|uniref:WGR domain-containing protein n=1 Tax=Thiocapsa roseopersicina TaxID=1058 RepID=A0A1H3B6U6_THIRO|nr:hypothetical protein [Thiocapsa roseopersicina]SDX37633.1 hypothetical protein SAMN05421783_12325 [Thiocapsa roseopersicina]